MLCPTCRQPTQWEGNTFRPFCSEQCRLLDLDGWLSEEFRVPAEEASLDVPSTDSTEDTFDSNGTH